MSLMGEKGVLTVFIGKIWNLRFAQKKRRKGQCHSRLTIGDHMCRLDTRPNVYM